MFDYVFFSTCKQQQPWHVSSLSEFKAFWKFRGSTSHPPPVPEGLVSWYSISGKNSAMEDVILVICAARELRFLLADLSFWKDGLAARSI